MAGFDHRDTRLRRKAEPVVVCLTSNENIAILFDQPLLVFDIHEQTKPAPGQTDPPHFGLHIRGHANAYRWHGEATFHPFNQFGQCTLGDLVHLHQPVNEVRCTKAKFGGENVEDADVVYRTVQTHEREIVFVQQSHTLPVERPIFPSFGQVGIGLEVVG